MDAKIRKLDRKRDFGTVQGDPVVRYWQDGIFFDVKGLFVRADPNAVSFGRIIKETSKTAERASEVLERARRILGDTSPIGGHTPRQENDAALRAEELSDDA